MSNLLSQASLVMIPSGYKEDVVYSAIPTNGNGDLSFTRASNGTRVNSAGLVEVVPWNLLTYSEDLSNAIWTKEAGNSITTNSTTAPNGTTTADTISATASNELNTYQFANTDAGVFTYSVYIKKNATNLISTYIYQSSVGFKARGEINFDNGTFTTSLGTGAIESVGNGWYRVFLTATLLTAQHSFGFYTDSVTGTRSVYAWGAQANIGSTAKPYFPTTDRLNVPRLTYQNGGGGCPSLLLEKQSTNLCLWSEDFTQTDWTKSGVTISANNITSPDGTQNADLLTTTSATICGAYQLISTGSGTFSFSIFAKKGNNNYLALNAQASSSNNCTAIFDLSDGTLGEYQTKGTTAYVSHKIENLGNDWYRCTMVLTTTTSVYFFPLFAPLKTGNTFTSGGEVSVASGKTLYLWGCQVEASSYATSLIQTTSSSATRVADLAVKSSISSLFGASATSLFMDFEITQVSNDATWTVTGYDGSNLFSLCQFGATTNFPRIVFDGGVDTTLGTALSIGRHKIAVSFATNDFRAYIDGALVLTDTSCTYNRYDRIAVNGTAWTGNTNNNNSFKLNQYAQFPTALTNAELASLTTI